MRQRPALRWPAPRRLPVAARLALVFSALAVFSTGFTLLLQDRSLDRDLEQAARARLDRSARAADQLLRAHLSSVAERYGAVSRTPELRANLEVGHAGTLRFFAEELRRAQGAELIVFERPDGTAVAWAGDDGLAREVPASLRELAASKEAACIEIDPAERNRGSRLPTGAYRSCRYPGAPLEATLLVVPEAAFAAVAIRLETGGRRVGQLVVAEAIGDELLAAWSGLCGAEIGIGSRAPFGSGDLVETAARFPTGSLWISSSLEPERLALRGSRRNLLFSGLLVLAAAIAASIAMARGLARPLHAMQEATERIRHGDLSTRLRSKRNDELGELSEAFDSMLDRLDESQKRLRRVQELARFGEWSVRFEDGRVEGSPEFQRALGMPGAASIDLHLSDALERIHPEDRASLRREIERSRQEERTFELQVRAPRGTEHRVLLFRGRSRLGKDGTPRLEGSVQDLTEQKRVEEQLRYLSYHNPVTGLANMRFFRERLLQSCRRGGSEAFTVMFLGLDNFQLLNQTHGHSFGDAVLGATARRLLELFPSESADGAAIAHLGGDEFAFLLDSVSTHEEATGFAETLLERTARPHVIQGEETVVTASVGICFGSSTSTPESLLRNCDSALRRAKDAGRNRIEFFDELARERSSRRLRIDSGLRRALESQRLVMHFQPRIATATESVVCFEALMRWNDEELGAVSPSEFIPIAEQSGRIQQIGSWAMGEALEQLRRWSDEGFDRARVSINLSPHQFHREIDAEIRERLGGLDPQRIELEVTEYSLLRDEGAAIDALHRLRDAGFRISLDDFGTGYSSLSYLRKLPLDSVKIDGSFISHIDRDPDAAALIASIVAMVRTLRLGIVAECVETAEQREMLIEMGCDELQGFYYSPAVPSDEAMRLLAQPLDEKPAPPRGRRPARRTRTPKRPRSRRGS